MPCRIRRCAGSRTHRPVALIDIAFSVLVQAGGDRHRRQVAGAAVAAAVLRRRGLLAGQRAGCEQQHLRPADRGGRRIDGARCGAAASVRAPSDRQREGRRSSDGSTTCHGILISVRGAGRHAGARRSVADDHPFLVGRRAVLAASAMSGSASPKRAGCRVGRRPRTRCSAARRDRSARHSSTRARTPGRKCRQPVTDLGDDIGRRASACRSSRPGTAGPPPCWPTRPALRSGCGRRANG